MALFTPQATTLSSDPQTQSAGQDSLMSVNICDTLSPVLALVSTWMASISLAYLQQQGLASLRPYFTIVINGPGADDTGLTLRRRHNSHRIGVVACAPVGHVSIDLALVLQVALVASQCYDL